MPSSLSIGLPAETPRRPWVGLLLLVPIVAGCSRGFFRRAADRDAYSIVAQKGTGANWQIQPGFTIEPDSRSRFYDPTCRTDPRLPVPAPQLYEYSMPLLATPEAPPRNLESSPPALPDTPPPQSTPATELDNPPTLATGCIRRINQSAPTTSAIVDIATIQPWRCH